MRTLVIERTYSADPFSYDADPSASSNIDTIALNVHEIRYRVNKSTIEGGLNLKNDKLVYELVLKILEERMELGLTTFVYDFSYNVNIIKEYYKLAEKYGYKMYCIENNRDEDCFNGLKEEWFCGVKRTNELWTYDLDVYQTLIQGFKQKLPRGVIQIQYESKSVDTVIHDLFIVNPRIISLSVVSKVVAIGDIHGCYNALLKYFNENKYDEDAIYVFCGDYIDRGPESFKVLDYLNKNFIDKSNVIMLEGNHERSLFLYGNNRESYSEEFEKNTKPQLTPYSRKEILEFYNKLQPYYTIYDMTTNTEMDFTHGGYHKKLITSDVNISIRDIIRGVGGYEAVCTSEASACTGIPFRYEYNGCKFNIWNYFNIHGHRNKKTNFVTAYNQNCYGINLEQHVEFGGKMRVIELYYDEEHCKRTGMPLYRKFEYSNEEE